MFVPKTVRRIKILMTDQGFIRKLCLSLFRRKDDVRRGESVSLDSLYRLISYRFQDATLVHQALTHRSFISGEFGRGNSNERLEFLGDAVLGLIVTEELYRKYSEKSEGELTKAKSVIVSREMLGIHAKRIGLGKYLFVGDAEEKTGGRDRLSILTDAYEALLGAIYLDGGLDEARRFVQEQAMKDIDTFFMGTTHSNYKSWLLEHVQAEGIASLEYRVLKERGPDHRKEFTVEVIVGGEVLGKGKGYRKKTAEQGAAFQAIQRLGLKGE